MRFSLRKAVAAVVLAGTAALVVPMAVSSTAGAVGPNIYGITTANEVITLTSNLNNNAATVLERHAITGLFDNDTVVGLDRGPLDGQLYTVGRNADGIGFLYRIDPATGVAEPIGAIRDPQTFAPVPLTGTRFAVDVHPTGDAMNIISNTGMNAVVRTRIFPFVVVAPFSFLGYQNPSDAFTLPNPLMNGLQGAAWSQNESGNQSGVLYTVTGRKLYISDPLDGTSTFVADLQSFSNTDSGLDITTSSGIDTGYYARGTATNSSVYILNLTNGTTVRLLTTPIGTVLREIAL